MVKEKTCKLPNWEYILQCDANTTEIIFYEKGKKRPENPYKIPSGLSKYKNLKKIFVHGFNIKKLENLEEIKNLEELTIKSSKIKKIEGLDELVSLKKLDLRRNEIKEIKNLDKLVNLEELDLRDNKITKIKGLDNLKKLRVLNLGGKSLTKRFYERKKLGSGKWLTLTKIEGLENLKNLEELRLENTDIKKIENIEQLTNLKKLILYESDIRIVENIDKLKNLEELDLEENTHVSFLKDITKLKNLDEVSFWLRTDESKYSRMLGLINSIYIMGKNEECDVRGVNIRSCGMYKSRYSPHGKLKEKRVDSSSITGFKSLMKEIQASDLDVSHFMT